MLKVVGGTIPAAIWKTYMTELPKFHRTDIRTFDELNQQSIFDKLF
jgi:hypothetical protein